jgi:hypothetical protein
MKRSQLMLVLATTLCLATSALGADFGVRAGRYNDSKEEFVGAEVFFSLGAVSLNPNLEYSLEEDVNAGSVNLDMTVDLAQFGTARPYAGLGVGLLFADAETVETQTDVVGNLIGGVAFELGLLKPYAQVKYFRTLEGGEEERGDDVALTIGLRF